MVGGVGTYMPLLVALVADSTLTYSHGLKAVRAGKAVSSVI